MTNTNDIEELVIVDVAKLVLFTYVDTDSTGEAELERANKYRLRDIANFDTYRKEKDDKEFWEKRYNDAVSTKFEIMKANDFWILIKEYYQGKPLEIITEEEFTEAFEMLPPAKWCNITGVEMFCVSEMLDYDYTYQYAQKGDKFYKKIVNIKDRSTWIYKFI